MHTQGDTLNSTANATQPSKKDGKGYPRTDLRYWLKRVKKVTRDGYTSPFYSVQLSYKGRRMRFPLETSIKEAAAAKAQQMFLSLRAIGWEETLVKFKPKVAKPTGIASVGELIKAVEDHAGIRRSTFVQYRNSLRQIVSGIEGIGDQPKLDKNGRHVLDEDGNTVLLSRFDYQKGGQAAWAKKVDSVSLFKLTSERIQHWMLEYIAQAGEDRDAKKRATNSANSHLRNARSLFSAKTLQHVANRLLLPEPLPFASIKPVPNSATRYISRIDAKQLIAAAKKELGGDPARVEQYKLFCIIMLCGLRRKEADSLLWSQVDFGKKCINIETTKYFQPKSEDSHGQIDIPDGLMLILQEWHKSAKGEFVVESDKVPRYGTDRTYYRCQRHLKGLATWLKAKGVQARKPLHELRKELGSDIANEIGIFAAQRVLRHCDIRLTSQYYADKKKRLVTRLDREL